MGDNVEGTIVWHDGSDDQVVVRSAGAAEENLFNLEHTDVLFARVGDETEFSVIPVTAFRRFIPKQ